MRSVSITSGKVGLSALVRCLIHLSKCQFVRCVDVLVSHKIGARSARYIANGSDVGVLCRDSARLSSRVA